MEERVRVRLAFSPGGALSVADAHTALFNWLFARGRAGEVALRLADTDLAAAGPEAERGTYVSLKWLGLDWDEGPVSCERFSRSGAGAFGPYRQSERLSLYREQLEVMKDQGLAYPCFCLPEQLESDRRERARRGLLPVYSGRCRGLREAEVDKRLAAGQVPAWRLMAPAGDVAWEDRVRGPMSTPASALGDIILLRANGRPTPSFAAAVDDRLMRITHVIAPDRHWGRAPQQIMIARALGWPPPVFAHLPLITGPDHKPLALRHGTYSLDDLYRLGFTGPAIVNYLALLGWSPKEGEDVHGLADLARSFELERVSASPAAFDLKKLEWLNGRAIRGLSPDRLAEMLSPYLRAAGLDPEAVPAGRLVRAAALSQGRITRLADAPEELRWAFERPSRAVPGLEGEGVRVAARLAELAGECPEDEWGPDRVRDLIRQTGEELGLSGPALYIPVRMAVSGRDHGPDLAEMLAALGRDEARERLRAAG